MECLQLEQLNNSESKEFPKTYQNLEQNWKFQKLKKVNHKTTSICLFYYNFIFGTFNTKFISVVIGSSDSIIALRF